MSGFTDPKTNQNQIGLERVVGSLSNELKNLLIIYLFRHEPLISWPCKSFSRFLSGLQECLKYLGI